MSGTLVDEPLTPENSQASAPASGPDVSRLEDHTPEYLRVPRAVAGLVLAIGLIYLILCFRPIWHTDVWGHLAYGRTIWQTKSLPATEPLMNLAKGVPFVDSAWLSQLIGYSVMSQYGIAGLQGLYALSISACLALMAVRGYRLTRNGWFAIGVVVPFLALSAAPLTVMRPQLAGLVCFVALLTRLTSRRLHRSDWVLVPLIFCAWANLHGSFLVGLLLMGCFHVGRAVDLWRRTGSLRVILRDHRVRRSFLLLELATAAVLLNPYGLRIYTAIFEVSYNLNLQNLTEWNPLSLREIQGQVFGVVAVALAMLYRISPRRVRTWEVLSLVVLGWSSLWSGRMLVWWAPVASYLLLLHGYAVWRQWRRLPLVTKTAVKAGKWSVVAVGLIWIFFAYSPLGVRIVHGKAADFKRAVSSETPVAAAEYLIKHPPQGQVFNTFEWGDYLLWAGPPGMEIFVNSHAHLVPREIWQAYLQISEQQVGWEEALDRYGINTIVIDKLYRESFIKRLKDNDRWTVAFEQDGQVIFERKSPI